jgi:hypothetical protein
MSDISLAQTFSEENYKPIVVMMYIESIEERADSSGRDTVGKERFCCVAFYNGLRGKASQWFESLELEVQSDWR